MSPAFDISIVISSYNREDKVFKTIDSLFKSDLAVFTAIELIIIDDGSPRPVENVLKTVGEKPACITLRLLQQKNAGIGATRNRGYREARSPIVLFIDDDIILYEDTVKKIFLAQQENIGPVIFGSYPFISHQSPALEKFAQHLYGYNDITQEPAYQQVEGITSGLLCVNKEQLDMPDYFYRDDLTVPAAEEHEIIARFHRENIPIFHARHIVAIHNHHLELDWLIIQQYKYGLGTAEAFIKYPLIAEMEKYAELKRTMNGATTGGWKGIIKNVAASLPGRKLLLLYARLANKLLRNRNHNFVFGLLTSAYYRAGYRDGLKKFSSKNSPI